jgi:hypothetical protein
VGRDEAQQGAAGERAARLQPREGERTGAGRGQGPTGREVDRDEAQQGAPGERATLSCRSLEIDRK